MLADMKKYRNFVLSSVKGDFGEEIVRKFDLVVLIDAPKDLRMARIVQREIDKFGGRVLPGGDMHEGQERFHAFAAARDEDYAERWTRTLTCPVIRVDGTRDWRETAAELAETIQNHNII
jgi:thymidylate kinase